MFADVILPLPLAGAFTYSLPVAFAEKIQVGCRVVVPFGKRKFYSAIVVRKHDEKPSYDTKEVLELLDEQPILFPIQKKLWEWMADYYLCTEGEIFKAALPSGLKLESESVVVLNTESEDDVSLTPSERKIVDVLTLKTELSLASLQKETGIRSLSSVVKNLLEKGVVLMKEEVKRLCTPKVIRCVRLSQEYFDEQRLNIALDEMKRAPKQEELLLSYLNLSKASVALSLHNPLLLDEVPKAMLMKETSASQAAFVALKTKGVLEIYEKETSRLKDVQMAEGMCLHSLTDEQQIALSEIRTQFQKHDVCLLHGVTSCGKTEIYIHLIHEAIQRGKQVLYLLPEIVLTTQLTDRLKRVFGDRLGVYHSKYSDAERVEIYRKMLSDSPYDIIVGVRSSVFLPFQRLGLVVVDEEHESSYKQQDPAPRYHARSVALVLARMVHAKTLLGTATPCLETYFHCCHGKYGLVCLRTRYRNVQLPEIEVVDMADLYRRKMIHGPFSPQLLQSIRDALESQQQVILFLNRRGYAPMVECHVCGWVPRCQNCDVSLTYHKMAHRMTCHYCGAVYEIPSICPSCESPDLQNRGYGTERIVDDIHAIFPEARVARMDLDTTRSRRNYEQILEDFRCGKTDILVGTQMVAKGLDFDRVCVVGILDAGSMLNLPDFRSYERAFQMMAQVSGRAGRRSRRGKVILQTKDVKASVIHQVVKNDFEGMYEEQMEERNLFMYPPYCRMIDVYLKHRDEECIDRMAQTLSKLLRQVFEDRVLGPDRPYVSRVQTLHIRKIILKIELSLSLKEVRDRLRKIQSYLLGLSDFSGGQIYYDVDPY